MPVATPEHPSIGRFVLATAATIRLANWRPTGWSAAVGVALLATSRPESLDLRLALSGALVASSCGFLLDDPAAATAEPMPTTLRTRRVQRITLAAVPLGLWWTAALTLMTARAGELPLTGRTLLFAALATSALAASAIATRQGDRNSGGVAGAVTALLVFASTLLPDRTWLPLPPAPDAPDATLQLTLVLLATLTVLWFASADPATGARLVKP